MNTASPIALSSLLIFMLVPKGFAAPEAGTVSAEVATYDGLIHAIREARAQAQTRVERAVEQEKVREAWKIGRLIDEHILLNKARANYGEQVLKRLSADLEISETELYYMLEFARSYAIFPPGGKLSWSHYRALLSVDEPEKRERLARAALEKNWSRDTLRREVGKIRTTHASALKAFPTDEPLIPLKGTLDTYRVVTAVAGEWKGKPVIDLGFSNYYRPSGHSDFREGDILRVSNGKLKFVKKARESLKPLQIFSYRAYVLDITDGDTLWVLIDLGFGFTTRQQLRLRGLDAPEIERAEGQEAKRFVEKELKNIPQVVITSTRSDKYDRYLADVFYQTKSGEQFLNNRLLEEGLANRV